MTFLQVSLFLKLLTVPELTLVSLPITVQVPPGVLLGTQGWLLI